MAPTLAIVMFVSGCGDGGSSDTSATGSDAARFCEISAVLAEARTRSSETRNEIGDLLILQKALSAEAVAVVPVRDNERLPQV